MMNFKKKKNMMEEQWSNKSNWFFLNTRNVERTGY